MGGGYSNVPEDIEIEICSWLPAKSVLRFKCVCRAWKTLFTNTTFTDLHVSRATTRKTQDDYCLLSRKIYNSGTSYPCRKQETVLISLLSPQQLELISDIELPQFRRCSHLHGVTGCCNGILCLSHINGCFVLFNPTTKQYKTLPIPPNNSTKLHCVSYCNHVFGFDVKSGDYKILRLAKSAEYVIPTAKYNHMFEIFSLRSGSWTVKSICLEDEIPFDLSSSGFVHGVYHFVANKQTTSSFNSRDKVIVTFNLHDEVFGAMKHPIGNPQNPSKSNAYVVNGSLAILEWDTFFLNSSKHINVWIMKEYGVEESWNRSYKITKYWGFTLDFWGDNKFLLAMPYDWFEFFDSAVELASYDLITHEIEKHKVIGIIGSVRFFPYTPSLASLESSRCRQNRSREIKSRESRECEENCDIIESVSGLFTRS